MKHKALAPTLAMAALVSAQSAQAQQAPCVEPDDLTDMITYAMPIAYDAAMGSCSESYSANSFMRNGGTEFIERFRSQQDAAWPGALRVMQVFIASSSSSGDDAMTGMISALPEEQLRPFIDGIAQQMIGEQIKPDVCSDIEEGLELVAPLPVENVSGLFTFVAERAGLDNPSICSVPAKQEG